jgi:hypothetical protein
MPTKIQFINKEVHNKIQNTKKKKKTLEKCKKRERYGSYDNLRFFHDILRFFEGCPKN